MKRSIVPGQERPYDLHQLIRGKRCSQGGHVGWKGSVRWILLVAGVPDVENGKAGPYVSHSSDQLRTGHARHLGVGDEEIDLPKTQAQLIGRLPVVRLKDTVAGFPNRLDDEVQQIRLLVGSNDVRAFGEARRSGRQCEPLDPARTAGLGRVRMEGLLQPTGLPRQLLQLD
jgi:hypothetical protein